MRSNHDGRTDWILHPVRSCLGALVALGITGYVLYSCASSIGEPKESSRTEKIERLVSDSQSLIGEINRFDEDNWQDVVPNVRRMASTVEQDAYQMRDDDHWYKDPWAIGAIILLVLLIIAGKQHEKMEKKLRDDAEDGISGD